MPYSTPFLPVNMRGLGLRVYYGGQRGNGIGGLLRPFLTRVAIPLAKRVAVPLAKRALRAVGKKVMNYAAKMIGYSKKKTHKHTHPHTHTHTHKQTRSDPAKRQWSYQEAKNYPNEISLPLPKKYKRKRVRFGPIKR